MKITIEVYNTLAAGLVCEGIREAARQAEKRRNCCREEYDQVQLSDLKDSRKQFEQDVLATKGAKLKILSDLLWQMADDIYGQIAAEESRQEEDKNRPLTLDELNQMEGQPVWVDHCHGGEWVVVHWNYARFIAGARQACLRESGYGEDWLAYRSKPKEATL